MTVSWIGKGFKLAPDVQSVLHTVDRLIISSIGTLTKIYLVIGMYASIYRYEK